MKFAERAKAYAALIGGVVTAILGIPDVPLPDSVRPWLMLASALCTAVATFAIPNTPADAVPLKPATHPESPYPPDGV